MRTIRFLLRAILLGAIALLAAAYIGTGRTSGTVDASLLTKFAAMEPVGTTAPEPIATPEPTSTPEPTQAPTPTPAPTPFSAVWMVDTQMYCSTYPDILQSIFQWTADVRDERNVEALLHSGDIVRSVYYPEQMERLREATALLPKDLHCVTAAGNHDCGIDPGDHSFYLDFRFDTDFLPENGYGEGESYYTTFTAGGVPILVLSIAYFDERESAPWARDVLAAHPDHYAILLVHSYLDSVYGVNGTGYTSSGELLRERVVIPSPNLRLVLCGHMRDAQHSELALDDDGNGTVDRTVIQMMLNPQENVLGGGGFLRLLTFDPAGDTLTVETYSPYLDEHDFKGNDFGPKHVYTKIGMRAFLPAEEPAA